VDVTHASMAGADLHDFVKFRQSTDPGGEASPGDAWEDTSATPHQLKRRNAGGTGWDAIGGAGSVTTVSVVPANGFAGTVAGATSTPAITLSTTVTGLLKGNGTAVSAAVVGTDYVAGAGGTSIVTVGTVTTGTWQATAVGLAYGGTGADLHATGPGVLVQASGGANVTVVSPYGPAGVTAGQTSGSGTAVLVDDTFTGNTGSSAYTIGDVVAALKAAKILAA